MIRDKTRTRYKEMKYHDEIAHEYNTLCNLCTPFKELEMQKTLSSISKLVDKNDVFLDIGCGTGYVLVPLLKSGLIGIGLDISREMISEAKQKCGNGSNVNFVLGDAENLPFSDSTFDLVHCRATLHHVPEPAIAISEISRVLKKGGYLYLREPLFHKSFIYLNKIGIRRCKLRPTHQESSGFLLKDIKKILLDSCLKVKYIEFFPFIGGFLTDRFVNLRGGTLLFFKIDELLSRSLLKKFALNFSIIARK